MNESQTRLVKIDPALKAAGWGVVEDSYILTEVYFTNGRISASQKAKGLKADYILQYKGVKLAVVEAKRDEIPASEGVMQAKDYAGRLDIRFTYATNGDSIYFMDLKTGREHEVDNYPTPEELWQWTFGEAQKWRDAFLQQPYSPEARRPRYYQEIAISRVLSAIAEGRHRVLLTLATGTGKTFVASQIAYKLFHTKWNVRGTDNRPRILFLADRNVLADQAFVDFSNAFKADALVRIAPDEIRRRSKVPTNGSIFFTIFQTFMSGEGEGYFGEYPKDFFDLVVIDECHRGGANDQSNWRKILEYFDSAVHLGLTATPKRDDNVDTYKYFGQPVYEYSLKQGIDDGFLTPFRHCKMQSNIDDYIYTPEDDVVSGVVQPGRTYKESDFYQGNITIRQRDEARVREFMQYIRPDEKTLVFCYTQNHAAAIRDMINQAAGSTNPCYCVRVTANDGALGDQYLNDFKDNEKTIPTILTTSQKLSTGVDARNVRNIVLLRPVNSMIEFKQIIGRGTRVYDGKYYFTIYDFVRAYEHFADPLWDGEPVCPRCGNNPCTCEDEADTPKTPKPQKPQTSSKHEQPCPECGMAPCICPKPKEDPLEIRLSESHVLKIRHIKTDMFWGADGVPVSTEDFLKAMFGKLPEFFTSAEDLQEKWSNPETREQLLNKMGEAGYGVDVLKQVRTVIDAEKCDLLDVLEYIAYNIKPMERIERVQRAATYKATLTPGQQMFVDFMTSLYVAEGVVEFGREKLPEVLSMKYGSVPEGISALGDATAARAVFYGFQRAIYAVA